MNKFSFHNIWDLKTMLYAKMGCNYLGIYVLYKPCGVRGLCARLSALQPLPDPNWPLGGPKLSNPVLLRTPIKFRKIHLQMMEEKKKEKREIMMEKLATASLPVIHLMATDCNVAACAHILKSLGLDRPSSYINLKQFIFHLNYQVICFSAYTLTINH